MRVVYYVLVIAAAGEKATVGASASGNAPMTTRISRRTTNVTISLFVISALFITLVLPYKVQQKTFVCKVLYFNVFSNLVLGITLNLGITESLRGFRSVVFVAIND